MKTLNLVVLLTTFSIFADGETERRSNIFNQIYTHNYWGSPETRSGTGSEVSRTREIQTWLPEILKRLGIKVLLDAGCGECNWIKKIDDLGLDLYIGLDIVNTIIEINQAQFGNEKCRFMCLDVVCDELPAVQAILCRDCLAHMSHNDIKSALRNFKRSGAKYLIATNYPRIKRNTSDVGTGGYYPINLLAAPFNLPEPIMAFAELSAEPDARRAGKWLYVWCLDDVQIN